MRKGLISFPTKLFLGLIGGAVFIVFIINMIMLNSSVEVVRETGGFSSVGLNVVRKLTTRCLAYSAGTPQSNLLDYTKLKDYEGKHEPCVYSFDYGWQAKIRTMKYTDGRFEGPETIEFGAEGLSSGEAIIQDRITKQSIPVTVTYPNNHRYMTSLNITVVSGDMELLAGKIDALCIANDTEDLILSLDYRTKVNNGNKKVCVGRSYCYEGAAGFEGWKEDRECTYFYTVKVKDKCKDKCSNYEITDDEKECICWACRKLRTDDYKYCDSNELRIYDIFTSQWKESYMFQPDSYVISVSYNSTEDQIQLKPWLPT